MSAPERRFELLDALRGGAAVWVLWVHCISGEFTHLNRQNVLFDLLCRFMENGHLGVPIFFMISGYGISWSVEHHASSPWAFLRRRMLRIYPAFWVSIVLISAEIFILIKLGLNHHAALLSWRQALIALPLLTTPDLHTFNPVYWTLTYEMHFYLWTALALWLFRRRPFLLFDVFTLAVLAEHYHYFTADFFATFFQLRHYWLDFYCGNLLYRCIRSFGPWPGAFFCASAAAALAALAVLTRAFPPRYQMAPILSLVLLCLYPADRFICRSKTVSALRSFGRLSFSLFLTNVMVAPKLIGFINRKMIMGNTLYLFVLTLGTAGSIAWAYAFYRFVEQPLAALTEPWASPGSGNLGSKPSVQLE